MSEIEEARAALRGKLLSKAIEFRAAIDEYLKKTGEEADTCSLILSVGNDGTYFHCSAWKTTEEGEMNKVAFQFGKTQFGQLRDETEDSRRWREDQRNGKTV